jgi:hypothetical protein
MGREFGLLAVIVSKSQDDDSYAPYDLGALNALTGPEAPYFYPPPFMGGVRGGWRQQVLRIASKTPSIFPKTSLFQKRKVLK